MNDVGRLVAVMTKAPWVHPIGAEEWKYGTIELDEGTETLVRLAFTGDLIVIDRTKDEWRFFDWISERRNRWRP